MARASGEREMREIRPDRLDARPQERLQPGQQLQRARALAPAFPPCLDTLCEPPDHVGRQNDPLRARLLAVAPCPANPLCCLPAVFGKSTYCDTLEVPPGPLRIRLGPHGRAGAHQAPEQAACARGRRAARCAGRAANCGPRATKTPVKLRIAAASSVACRVSASVRTHIHPAGARGHHWGRVGARPQRDARASGGGPN